MIDITFIFVCALSHLIKDFMHRLKSFVHSTTSMQVSRFDSGSEKGNLKYNVFICKMVRKIHVNSRV